MLDSVDTYFGLRQVTTAKYDGRNYEYIYLNGKPVFLSGLLDQGFWAEGIYTAPSEEALKYDILAMKNDGFNMIRKHLKIEDPRSTTGATSWASSSGRICPTPPR